MATISLLLNMAGGLCMFLFGMKTMSAGLQKSAGERIRKTLNFMTDNRFAGVFTGFMVTAIVQSSTAVTVMIVSFVNAGLLSLTQSIGVIFGANIGTTLTAWIISIVGFKISIDSLALPAIGIGFILGIIRWKYRSLGDFLLGFGFLFLGLFFLTSGMANVNDVFNFGTIGALRGMGFTAILIGFGTGLIMTLFINSSTATVALIMALAFQDIVTYEMAAGMVLGSNLGTTLNAPLASLAGNTSAKRAALVHVMFNVIGAAWALPLTIPLLKLVNLILPGDPWAAIPSNEAITLHIAGLHTTFNIINTLLFLPFVNQFSRLISFLVREKGAPEKSGPYTFAYISSAMADSPELNIMRAEKEICDMAGIVSFMYSRFCAALSGLREADGKGEENAAAICEELKLKEKYVDEMRETLSGFLIECTRGEHRNIAAAPRRGSATGSRPKLNSRSQARVARLLRVIGILEEMSDDCYSISRLLQRSVRKDCVFKEKQIDDLVPYVGQVGEFLVLLEDQLGRRPTPKQKAHAAELERSIDKNRKKLNKLGRKRIKAGENVRTELYFIDLVRRIEKLGDYCFDIAEAV